MFSAYITPKMLTLCRVTEAKVFFLVLVYVFNFDLFEFPAAILQKGLLCLESTFTCSAGIGAVEFSTKLLC